MHIVVVGAFGGTGRHVALQAAAAGHRVTALVRNPAKYQPPAGVEVIQGNVVTDPRLEIPDDADAVISALGRGDSRQGPESTCLLGVVHVLAAMYPRGIRRLVVISAAPVLKTWEGAGFFEKRLLVPMVTYWGKHIYPDLQRMETYLKDRSEDWDWTVVRPGYLVDADEVGPYQMALDTNVSGPSRRPDLAAGLLEVLEDTSTYHRAYGFGSKRAQTMDDAAWHGPRLVHGADQLAHRSQARTAG
ncbi:SDR family oxidoreductase [Nesterenkonia sp. MY13]|uniref:SDR family oxidoreductase n=1 Tax=Nesterenkonia sedimenti TaxID=1463632 RepID=A0A7X8TI38_9MICC|nr:NAD(P)-binding oxidoreductase [Nesterenkonia sedimenti]NLS09162.1 SDR family oxidoreductase [Nesterenkonia sedimenti]